MTCAYPPRTNVLHVKKKTRTPIGQHPLARLAGPLNVSWRAFLPRAYKAATRRCLAGKSFSIRSVRVVVSSGALDPLADRLTMPGIVVFKRRWSVGSDDFVVPAVLLLLLHSAWWVILLLLIFKEEWRHFRAAFSWAVTLPSSIDYECVVYAACFDSGRFRDAWLFKQLKYCCLLWNVM